VYPKIGIEPKKSCISIYLPFFAEPNEPKEPKLDALTIQHRRQSPPVTPSSNFFSSTFQSFTDPKIGLHLTPMLTSNRRDAYPAKTSLPALPAHVPDRQICVTKSPAIPAMPSPKRTYPHTTITLSSRELRHKTPDPSPISPAKGL
jgi:hypothetical protein